VSWEASLDPGLAPYARLLVDSVSAAGYPIRVTSTRRTPGQQAKLYRRWLAGLSPYPAAPPGTSKHERGLAFDVEADPAVLEAMGALWESWGGTWGGRFGAADPIHFEV
jgi:hypothetical protein